MIANSRLQRTLCSALAAVAAAVLAVAVPGLLSAQTCLRADAASARMIDRVVALTAATDPDEAARRDQYGLLVAPGSAVQLVSDERVCTKALSAYNAALPTVAGAVPIAAVYVVRVGSSQSLRYVVMAPASKGTSEFQVNAVLDSKYVLLGKFSS